MECTGTEALKVCVATKEPLMNRTAQSTFTCVPAIPKHVHVQSEVTELP